jgi:hypothetical protein
MKPFVVCLVVIFSTAGCTIRVPGLNLGPLGPTASSSSSSRSSASNEAPALLESASTKAWRAVLDDRELERQLTELHERLEDLPKSGSTSPDQHAGWTLTFMKNDKLAKVAKGCAAGTFKGEELELESRRWLKARRSARS